MARNVANREASSRDLRALGQEIRLRYGAEMGWPRLLQLLEDRELVPEPCEVVFDADPLLPGECAHLARRELAGEGYVLYIHPVFQFQSDDVPLLVLQQLAFVVAGGMVSAEEAERFGAAVLGMAVDEFYNRLCEMAGQVGGDDLC